MKRFTQITISVIVLLSLLIPSGLQFAGQQISGVEAQTTDTTFAIITDFGYTNDTTVANVANMVNGWTPEFIVSAGDNNQGMTCDTACYQGKVGAYYGPQATPGRIDYMTPDNFYPVPGNHDYYAGGTGELGNYLAYFTSLINLPPLGEYTRANNRYYDFVRGPVHFFMLDSGENLDGSPYDVVNQKLWLQSALENSDEPWKIVVFHVPAYSSGTAHGDSTVMQWEFAQWGADFVISGHNHVYDRIYKGEGELRYFTAGASGSDTRACSTTYAGREASYCGTNAESGAMKVTASDTSITLEYITTNVAGTAYTPRDTYYQTQEAPTDPSISITPSSLEFTNPSEVKSYTVSGVRLTNNVVVTPSASIEISLSSDSGFADSPITLPQTGGELAATTIYTRIVSGAKSITGTVTNTSDGALQKDVTITADLTVDLCFDLTFQEGVDSYAGTVDTYIMEYTPDASYGSGDHIEWDSRDPYNSDPHRANYGLLRFDGIFGTDPGQIPLGSTIETATLTYVVSGTGDTADVNEVAIDWAEAVTYNTFGTTAGVQTGDYGLGVGSATATTTGAKTLDVQASLQRWSNGTINYGWIFRPTGSDGVVVRSSEYTTTTSQRPKLDVRYCLASTDPTIVVTPNALSLYALPSTVSDIKTYTVSGYNLEADITITPPTADFEISTDGVTFTNSPITLTQTGGTVSATTIYVRMKSLAIGTYSGNLTHTSGTLSETVNLTGVVSESYLGMVINGGIATTGSQQVILDMSYGGPTPTTMRFANVDPGVDCSTVTTWSTAEAYASTASWTLSGSTNGTYKVCAQASLDGTTYTLAAEDTINLQTGYIYPNPDLPASCGLDMVLLIDLSSSISAAELAQYKTALKSFVTALQNTPTNISLVTFDRYTEILDLNSSESGLQDWVRMSPTTATAINTIIDGLETGTGTNWDHGLRTARLQFAPGTDPSDSSNLLVFATDGDPSTWGEHDGDTSPALNGQYDTNLTYAIPEAEEAKADGIHILGLGVAITGDSVTRLEAVSGTDVYPGSDITIADLITSDFDALATALSNLVIELCGGTVTVNKVITTSTEYFDETKWIIAPAVVSGWTFTVTTVSTGDSIEGDMVKTTGDGGFVNYEVNLTGSNLEATLSIQETEKTLYDFVAAICYIDGVAQTVTVTTGTATVSNIPVQHQELTNCTFVNYTPNDPTGIELLYFRAQSLPDGVQLTWETASESDTLGFNLYRAAFQDGERVPLNGELIPTQTYPGALFGAVYNFFDADVIPGETYYYWLEEVSLDQNGVNNMIETSIIVPKCWIFVPLVTR